MIKNFDLLKQVGKKKEKKKPTSFDGYFIQNISFVKGVRENRRKKNSLSQLSIMRNYFQRYDLM